MPHSIRLISRGHDGISATPLNEVRPGSPVEKELKYLFENDYRVSQDGTKLVK